MTSAMPSLENPVKARLAAGQPALGLSVRLVRSIDIARIARATGHHFLFIDVQHAAFNVETIANLANAALAIGVAPLVRVRSVRDPDASVLLDSGATGIIYPDVSTPDEARAAVAAAKFAPIGRRSVGAAFPQYDGRNPALSELVEAINRQTLVVCMIETVEGVRNAEEIAAIEGVDVLHVGTNDLLVDMGKPGRFDDPELEAAIDRVIAAAKASGKHAGMGGIRDVARQAAAIRRGALLLTTQSDQALLTAAAQQWTDGIGKALAG